MTTNVIIIVKHIFVIHNFLFLIDKNGVNMPNRTIIAHIVAINNVGIVEKFVTYFSKRYVPHIAKIINEISRQNNTK